MGGGSGGNFGNTKGSNKIHGFPKKIHSGKQGKHMPSHNNYQKGKSIFYGSEKKAQQLINKYAGTGTWIGKNKERVDFGKVIGSYIDATGKIIKTTVGIIHYSKTGAHIVPAAPIK
jgi:hypothetical protein